MEAILASRNYIDVEPHYEWVRSDEYDTLLVDVSGFRKERLKVQVHGSRNLKITGERHVQGNQWCHFLKDFPIPEDCNIRTLQANLDAGILYVVLPKQATQVHSLEEGISPAGEQLDIIMKEDSSAKDVTSSNQHLQETSNQGIGELEDIMQADSPAKTSSDQHSQETCNQGIEAVVDRFRRKRQFLVNIVVAILVAGFGIYAKYRLRTSEERHRN